MTTTALPTNREPQTDAPQARPSFFLVGAPRCGTTALFRWLGQHPDLFLPHEKECHYFAKDAPGLRTVTDEVDYLRMFREARPGQLVGEASVMYLRSECAIDNVLRFAPDARLLVTLRDPLGLLLSWRQQLMLTDQEDAVDLPTAWRLQASRRNGQNLPPHTQDPLLLQYEAIAKLGEQVERLLAKCDRRQILFLRYDHLRANPGATYRRVLSWLGVPDDGFNDFQVINANRRSLPPVLRRIWMRNSAVIGLRGAARRVVGSTRYAKVRDAFFSSIARPAERERPEESFRQELREVYRQDLSRLSELIDEDLQDWLP